MLGRGGGGNDLYLDCEGGCRHAFIFQDPSNCACAYKVDLGEEKGEHGQEREGKPRGLVCQEAEGKEFAGPEDLNEDPWRQGTAGRLRQTVWNIYESEGEPICPF